MYDSICLVNTSFAYSFSYRDSAYGKVVEKTRRLPFLRGGYMISLAHFFVHIVIDSGVVLLFRYCLMLYDSLPSLSFKWSFLS